MAHLSRLPAELLVMIIGYLGPAFFKSDIRCLTLFKGWYPIALSELLESIEIPAANLYKLLLPSDAKNRSIELLQQHAKKLHFRFGGVYQMHHRFQSEEDSKEALIPLQQWARYLRDRYRDVPSILNGCGRLQSLSFTVHEDTYQQRDPDDAAGDYIRTTKVAEDYILSPTIRDILSIAYTHKLTALELDLHGSACIMPSKTEDSSASSKAFLHLCPGISRLLSSPHLRRLVLCIDPICPVALELHPETTQISLQELIVCITPLAGLHSMACYTVSRTARAAVIEDQARHILTRMTRPKVVRVISHDGPKSQDIEGVYCLRIFDIITEKWDTDFVLTTEDNISSPLDGKYMYIGI
ncbi:hypothetical protein FQN54_006745 [Arachnomyces sp. PD_36]|nr:hypothetical protein FQN54_006745 [Arachnomyces sp. PD_36]